MARIVSVTVTKQFYAEDRPGFDRVNRSGQPDLGNDPIGLLPL